MDSPIPQSPFIYTQIGDRWRATAQSGLGLVSAHGRNREAARTALEQILAITRRIEDTRSGTVARVMRGR